MRTHPRGHRSCFPAGKHCDRLTSLQVNDDRSVLVTARDRPVIDADDPRSWFALAPRSSSQLPQHGVGTGAQAQDVSKPGRRLTTEGVAQRVQRASLRLRTTLVQTGQDVDVLGKRTTGAPAFAHLKRRTSTARTTRCSSIGDGFPSRIAGDDALTHTGEIRSIPPRTLLMVTINVGPDRPEIKPSTRPSHKVRETQNCFVLRLHRPPPPFFLTTAGK
ncbi:hypothetical protein D9M69_179170 [compost metagenome]